MYDYPVPKRTPGTGLLGQMFAAAGEGKVIVSPTHDYRGITYVWDVIRAMEQVMELPGGIYNFGSRNQRSTWETAGFCSGSICKNRSAAKGGSGQGSFSFAPQKSDDRYR